MKNSYAVDIPEETVNLIKEKYRLKCDSEVRKQIQAWVDETIKEEL